MFKVFYTLFELSYVKLLTIKITKNCLPKIGEAIILVYEKDRETKRTETPNIV